VTLHESAEIQSRNNTIQTRLVEELEEATAEMRTMGGRYREIRTRLLIATRLSATANNQLLDFFRMRDMGDNLMIEEVFRDPAAHVDDAFIEALLGNNQASVDDNNNVLEVGDVREEALVDFIHGGGTEAQWQHLEEALQEPEIEVIDLTGDDREEEEVYEVLEEWEAAVEEEMVDGDLRLEAEQWDQEERDDGYEPTGGHVVFDTPPVSPDMFCFYTFRRI
jgi:hypothetical protein